MNVANFHCSGCDLRGSNILRYERLKYQHPDGRTNNIIRSLVICHDCNRITFAESIPDQSNIDNSKYLTAKYDMDPYYLEWYISDIEQKIDLLKERKTPARCLECGSHNFIPIPVDNLKLKFEDGDPPWEIGLTHDKCGGQIIASFTDIEVEDIWRNEILYTIEGLPIK